MALRARDVGSTGRHSAPRLRIHRFAIRAFLKIGSHIYLKCSKAQNTKESAIEAFDESLKKLDEK